MLTVTSALHQSVRADMYEPSMSTDSVAAPGTRGPTLTADMSAGVGWCHGDPSAVKGIRRKSIFIRWYFSCFSLRNIIFYSLFYVAAVGLL